MKTLQHIFILTTAIFLFSASSVKGVAYPKDSTVTAETLITHADRAMLYIVKSAQETYVEKLKRSNKESEPFWGAVKKLNTQVDKLVKYSFLKDEAFHMTIAEAVTAKEEVITTYELLEVNDEKVKKGLDKVSRSIDLLYENYSKEAMRMKEGSALSAREKAQLDTLKLQNQELLKKLDELESKVGDNKEMLKKIKKIRQKSNEVVHCHHNSAGFFFAMSAMNMIHGWMWGCHWWWGPWGGWYPGFYGGFIEIYVPFLDDYAYDWGYLDGVIDAYEYELAVELEMDLYEMEAIGDYMDEIEIESELYDLDDHMYDEWDGAEELYDNTQEFDFPEYDHSLDSDYSEYDNAQEFDYPEFETYDAPMDDYQPYEQLDFADDFGGLDVGSMDFGGMDFGGFDDW